MSDSTPDGTSPRTFALNHLRPKSSFKGCSRISDYELLGKLGEGTFGEVHRARQRKTGIHVALKKIIMHHEKDGFPITALREIKLLKLLSHKNILKLEDMAIEHPTRQTDKRKKPIVYMATPYMDHDLSGLLDNPSVHFKEAQIKCYMLQLLEGLRYLHDSRILHRDMKAANLLINNQGILQIADFGLARHYEGDVPKAGQAYGVGKRDYTGLVVTRWYRPPELLLQLRQYTPAIDVWGVGCVLGEMLFGKPILAGESDAHQLDMIWDLMGSPNEDNMPGWKQLPGADHLSPRPRTGNLQNRFREQLDWRTRINAVDALQHPWFKMAPLPLEPHEIPVYEESHELDRRKFHDRKAALPPAPKGGTVGIGPDAKGATAGFNSNEPYGNGVPLGNEIEALGYRHDRLRTMTRTIVSEDPLAVEEHLGQEPPQMSTRTYPPIIGTTQADGGMTALLHHPEMIVGDATAEKTDATIETVAPSAAVGHPGMIGQEIETGKTAIGQTVMHTGDRIQRQRYRLTCTQATKGTKVQCHHIEG
ncbi:CMGC CDK kinase [Fusarium mundagurra]|uniref:Serine/threonine-protein kinase BUR1 n=1 Tax=Fusarium mundagurra TaxID=1567541 RepID=A0A8H5YHW8_9HYPO|nr:CMGC CDK kinase [Fusarium mundagurra]